MDKTTNVRSRNCQDSLSLMLSKDVKFPCILMPSPQSSYPFSLLLEACSLLYVANCCFFFKI